MCAINVFEVLSFSDGRQQIYRTVNIEFERIKFENVSESTDLKSGNFIKVFSTVVYKSFTSQI